MPQIRGGTGSVDQGYQWRVRPLDARITNKKSQREQGRRKRQWDLRTYKEHSTPFSVILQ